jgi:hypothetical protein
MRTTPTNIALFVGVPISGGALVDLMGRAISAGPLGGFDNFVSIGLGIVIGVAVSVWVAIHR